MDTPSPSAAERFRWGLLVLETLRSPEAFHPISLAVIDVEVIPPFSGAAADMWAWLIFDSRAEAAAAAARSEEVRAYAVGLLARAGYPSDALESFKLHYTGTPEIEAGGGRFAFFR